MSCHVYFDMFCTIFVKNSNSIEYVPYPENPRSVKHAGHSLETLRSHSPAFVPFAPFVMVAPGITEICIIEFKFVPARLTVRAGTTVVFRLQTVSNYHKLSCDKEFNELALHHKRTTASHTFMHRGSHRVYDEIFSFLECVIEVEGNDVPLTERNVNEGPSYNLRQGLASIKMPLEYSTLKGSFPAMNVSKVSATPVATTDGLSLWRGKSSHKYAMAVADGCFDVRSVGSDSSGIENNTPIVVVKSIKDVNNERGRVPLEESKQRKRLKKKQKQRKQAREKQSNRSNGLDCELSAAQGNTIEEEQVASTVSTDNSARSQGDIVDLLEESLRQITTTVAGMRQRRVSAPVPELSVTSASPLIQHFDAIPECSADISKSGDSNMENMISGSNDNRVCNFGGKNKVDGKNCVDRKNKVEKGRRHSRRSKNRSRSDQCAAAKNEHTTSTPQFCRQPGLVGKIARKHDDAILKTEKAYCPASPMSAIELLMCERKYEIFTSAKTL